MNCNNCGSKNLIKRGVRSSRIRYQCKACGHYQSGVPTHKRTAKILLLDIETLYMEVRGIWDLKTEYIQPDRVVKDWSILCYAAKWLFEEEIMGEVVTPKEAICRTEKSIIKGIWDLMNQADIIVTQNGISFDIPRLNTKFLLHGYPEPSHYLCVDTLRVARDRFHFTCNRIDDLGKRVLGLPGKTKMTIDDWDNCADGKKDALDKMLFYCKNDVAPLLEDLYLKFLPWIRNHPNLNIYTDHEGDVCPKCESTDLRWGDTYKTPQGLWDAFRCNACGAIGRGTKKLHSIKKAEIK